MKPSADVVAREVGAQTVLVHLGTNRIFSLNETAGRAWELMGQGMSREEMRAELLGRYAVEPAQLDDELDNLLAGLEKEGFLVRA